MLFNTSGHCMCGLAIYNLRIPRKPQHESSILRKMEGNLLSPTLYECSKELNVRLWQFNNEAIKV